MERERAVRAISSWAAAGNRIAKTPLPPPVPAAV